MSESMEDDMNWVPKLDFKPGALNRSHSYGCVKGMPTFREATKDSKLIVIPQSEWLDIIRNPNKPECSSLIWNTYEQKYGSCASEGMNKMCETLRKYANRENVLFNPLFTYHTVSGGRDGGRSRPSSGGRRPSSSGGRSEGGRSPSSGGRPNRSRGNARSRPNSGGRRDSRR